MDKVSFSVLKILAFAFLALYFSVGVGARLLSTGEEDFYPFFSWFLFSHVPQRVGNDFAINILKINGEVVKTPIPFEHAKNIYNTSRSLAEYNQYIRQLGNALKQNNMEEISRIRRWLENNFTAYNVTYEVSEITFDLIERFRSGKVIESKSLGQFNKE